MRQLICFAGEAGAGAKYMDIFDQLPTAIRRYLCDDCTINICLACLSQRAAHNIYDDRHSAKTLYLIHAFETGDLHDYERTIRSQDRRGYENRFSVLYGQTNYPPSYLYDPRSRAGDDYYSAERELSARMEQWARVIILDDDGKNVQSKRLQIDWT